MSLRPVSDGERAKYGDVFAFGPYRYMFICFNKDSTGGGWIGLSLTAAKPEIGNKLPFNYVHHTVWGSDDADGRRWERVL